MTRINSEGSPDWCGSVGWALSHKLKGHLFNSQSGHMPGLGARFPVRGVRDVIDVSLVHQSFSPSLSISLTFSLKVNKYSLQNKEIENFKFRGQFGRWCITDFLIQSLFTPSSSTNKRPYN